VKKLIALIGLLTFSIHFCFSQADKIKVFNRKWLDIPDGYASFVQIDYNKDGKDDIIKFDGYDVNIPYNWPGPQFYSGNPLVKSYPFVDNKKIFASKMIAADFDGNGYNDIFLQSGMDPSGTDWATCWYCDPILANNIMFNNGGSSFNVKELSEWKAIWRTSAVGDIDNDNDFDLLMFTTHQGKGFNNKLLINDGKGNFSVRKSDIDTIEWADATEMFDINHDGFIDLIINDIVNKGNRFRILWGDGNNFTPKNSITIDVRTDMWVLDIDAFDFDKDGFDEILIAMNDHNGNWKLEMFKTNDNKIFSNISNDISDNNPDFIPYAHLIDIGDVDGNDKPDVYVNDKSRNTRWEWSGVKLVRNNCNFSVKPTFNTSKYSFCPGDSLKLSITNVNKGDTLKWYFGNKSDLTNVSNKTFTDSSKVFVTRTDSLGCMISSDTIQLKKFAIPNSPSLSRDADNNLVSNSTGSIWYKDGVKIADTTQKIKPTSNGIYTATTTQNGCTSSISEGYYYLTNAVSNLSNGEYFKISPNPTSGELNINYRFSSNKDVYISVVDMNGRDVILNRKITSGNKINLGSVSKGNYIIQVKDKAGRLITSQKVVKE